MIAAHVRQQRGQTVVEYALILALVSLMGLALMPIGPWLIGRLTAVATAL